MFRDFRKGSGVTLTGLPFFDNFGDNYTVVAWASGFEQAGFTPVRIKPNTTTVVDLMLLGSKADFSFSQAKWDVLTQAKPPFLKLLTAGTDTDAAARDRYTTLMEDKPAVLACFFNLVTAMAQIHLPASTPLDYMRELIWDDTFAQDRFFAYADAQLVDQVKRAADQGAFAPEVGSALFHPGATSSFKQIQFGEADVQLTFHEDDRKTIGGVDCVKVEPDTLCWKCLGTRSPAHSPTPGKSMCFAGLREGGRACPNSIRHTVSFEPKTRCGVCLICA